MGLHRGDTATVEVSITEGGAAVNITAASSFLLKFKKPSGAQLSKTATVKAGTTDTIEASFGANELDEAGPWKVQPYIVGLDGWTGHGDFASFEVEDNL